MVRRHVSPHSRSTLLLALHLLLRRRFLFQASGQANLGVAFVAPISAVSLCRLLRCHGLLARHLGQVAAAAVVARQDDASMLVVARRVSETLRALGM